MKLFKGKVLPIALCVILGILTSVVNAATDLPQTLVYLAGFGLAIVVVFVSNLSPVALLLLFCVGGCLGIGLMR